MHRTRPRLGGGGRHEGGASGARRGAVVGGVFPSRLRTPTATQTWQRAPQGGGGGARRRARPRFWGNE
eukprot:scaffold51_cov401-Prasinococcus_capsulatus_cf.AAC.39